MNGLKRNWQWIIVSVLAVFIMIFVLTQGSQDVLDRTYTFDTALESGKWAMRFLLLSLTISPLNSFLNWRGVIPFRKPLGLWAFGFAALHFLLIYTDDQFGGGYHWLTFPLQLFIALGLTGLLILTAMAATSNRWAMKRLGKRWKQMHRLVYLAGIAVVYHAILAVDSSKRIFIRDSRVIYELHIYLVILTILLLVRIPLVRNQIKRLLPVRSFVMTRLRPQG